MTFKGMAARLKMRTWTHVANRLYLLLFVIFIFK
jgi:hypothetical protein